MTDLNALESLYFAALEKPPADRGVFLDAACGGNADLRARVERLLAAQPHVGGFLDVAATVAVDNPPTATFGSAPAADNAPLPVTSDAPGRDEHVGAVLGGKYKLVEEIGEGGMGTVFVAQQTAPVKRAVAVKVIKAGMDSRAVLARFDAERQALALMDHPNIAKVLDAGATDGGRPYFVMELVKGVPITRYCDERKLTPRERLELFVPVCLAIQHAHMKGVIHRDIKPGNVLVARYDDRPVVKVIDFGVAKAAGPALTDHTLMTGFGAVVGTPEYMSPEQASFNQLDVDTRSDVYALGVLLYELLTGTTPVDRKSLGRAALLEVLRVVREVEAPRPSAKLSTIDALASVAAARGTEPKRLSALLKGELDWVVLKALEKDRGRRYETANALARDVQRYLADEVVEARPPSAGYRLRKFARRHRGRVVAGGALAAMLAVVVGLIVYGAWWSQRQSAERGYEKALAAARDGDALKATLDQAEAALTAGRTAEAGVLLAQAGRQIGEQTPADLRERCERLRDDERTVRELNDIFEERWIISRSDTRLDDERAKRRYPALFQQRGLAVGSTPAEQIVERVRRARIADVLASGFAEWFFVEPKYPGLLAVVDLLDPEPGRVTLRAAIAAGDLDRVKEIGKATDGTQLTPAYAIGLGTHPAVEDGLRILKAAWQTNPDSFALAMTITSRIRRDEEKSAVESVGWARTAVALRPNNPLSHYYLALAFGGFGNFDIGNSVQELRQAIRLAPRFARAHGKLALLLSLVSDERGRPVPEALAVARTALELDDKNLYGNLVLFKHLMRNHEYLEAAKVFRRVAAPKQVDGSLPEDSEEFGYTTGYSDAALDALQRGLIRAGRPFEAYRLHADGFHSGLVSGNGHPSDDSSYTPACAAVLAGTGQGLDAPSADRHLIRKRALELLSVKLTAWRVHAAEFCGECAGLIGLPLGRGPLLAVPALYSEVSSSIAERARNRDVVHERMSEWLGDADLAGVRDEPWLAKLPADEREQWRRFWGEVRSLRDRTAPPKK